MRLQPYVCRYFDLSTGRDDRGKLIWQRPPAWTQQASDSGETAAAAAAAAEAATAAATVTAPTAAPPGQGAAAGNPRKRKAA